MGRQGAWTPAAGSGWRGPFLGARPVDDKIAERAGANEAVPSLAWALSATLPKVIEAMNRELAA